LFFFGLTGKHELAADVAVVQGAALAVFLAFSANSRNLLFSKYSSISFGQLVRFRGYFVLPFGLGVYLLCESISDVPVLLTISLIIRRCTEWLSELIITDRERHKEQAFAESYVLLQSISFSTLLLHGFVSDEIYNFLFLFWSFSPLLIGNKYFLKALRITVGEKRLPGKEIVFHLGSSWVIATTTFVLRIMIIALTSKAIGGQLITAFAIGGLLNSLYTYVFGPSLIHRETEKTKRVFRWIISSCIGFGIAVVLLAEIMSAFLGNTVLFFQALGFSVIGGAVMMVSQRKRIILLQLKHQRVFVQDLLSNALTVAVVPLVYYIAGPFWLGALFLCKACFTYIFYSMPLGRKAVT